MALSGWVGYPALAVEGAKGTLRAKVLDASCSASCPPPSRRFLRMHGPLLSVIYAEADEVSFPGLSGG
jgi:hypothetical protein